MAKKIKKNPLDFTGLDYNAIRNKIQNELDKDPRFETFRDSSIAKTVLDMFSATTDITNYYIERRAEEQFLDTARLRSSVIALSRLLGYTPRRPTPSNAGLSIVLKGPLQSGIAGETVTFYKATHATPTTFTGVELPFMLRHTYTYQFTADDESAGLNNPEWTKEVSFGVNLSADDAPIELDNNGSVDTRLLSNIELIQGEFKTETIFGGSNPQVGQLFQKYKINDRTFSNFYGETDFGYDEITVNENNQENLTKVGIGNTQANAFTDENLFRIRRKNLIDPNLINTDLEDIPRVVLLLSNMDEGITVYFGDDIFAKKGLVTEATNVYIRYLSTKGAKGNKVGIIGTTITSPNTFLTDQSNIDVTRNITFKFSANSVNGSDFESIDSIKLNAPEIYYSLDRLVTKRDYISYLKSQTLSTGGEIKNAIAWGEQEEVRRRGQNANFRFFNVMFFSMIGEVYNFIGNDFTIKSDEQLHEAHLEESEDFSTVAETTSGTGLVSADGYPEQSYFNVLVKGQPKPEIQRVADFRVISPTHPISVMYDRIETRAQTTIRPIYISPIVQKFKLKGRVTIGKLEDRVSVKRKINNNIYTWLNDNADFEVKIYKSPIVDIIQNETEVISTDIRFEPQAEIQQITTWDNDPDLQNNTGASYLTSGAFVTIVNTEITNYLDVAGFANVSGLDVSGLDIIDIPSISGASLAQSASTLPSELSTPSGIWVNSNDTTGIPEYWFEYKSHLRVGTISEYSFYNTLVANIYNSLGASLATDGSEFREHQAFKNIIFKLHNDLSRVIRTRMLDSEGNITNYSLGNEISQVEVELSYVYE